MFLRNKLFLLAVLTAATIVAVLLLPPIAQSLSFHHFADDRPLWGIPNFRNVASNIPFLIVATFGLLTVAKATVPPGIRVTYALLFVGVLLTGLGSAYYHWNPGNDALVWDRIPMTIVFMSFLSATVTELVSRRLGHRGVVPARRCRHRERALVALYGDHRQRGFAALWLGTILPDAGDPFASLAILSADGENDPSHSDLDRGLVYNREVFGGA